MTKVNTVTYIKQFIAATAKEIVLDCASYNEFEILLQSNINLTLANNIDNTKITIWLRQDSIGNRTVTFSSQFTFTTVNTNTVTSTANSYTVLKFDINNGVSYCSYSNNATGGGGGGGTWGSITGTLSDQTDLNTTLGTKVTGNTAITGATGTKITYDTKGLITVGANATQDDIGDGSTYKRTHNDFTNAYKTKVDASEAYRIIYFTALQSSPIWHTTGETLTVILDGAIVGVEYSTNNGTNWTVYSVPVTVTANSESLWRVTSFNPGYAQGCLTIVIS